MACKQNQIVAYTTFCLFLILLLFNFYYFFLRLSVSPYYYVGKFLHKPIDDILNTQIYQDLTEEYSQLNKIIFSEKIIVFVGDSITKRFNVQEFSKNINIVNRGIFSDTTYGLLNRVEKNINNLKIEKLFIMIGYNDLKIRTNEEIVHNIERFLLLSKAKEKYLQSILPVNFNMGKLNERIVLINEQLKKIAIEKGYIYVDLHSHFVGYSNCIKPELTTDGTHPNYMGNKLWFSLIESLL